MMFEWRLFSRHKLAITLLICFLQMYSGFCDCPSTVHKNVRGFGTECKYRCNCKDNTQCDSSTGECPNGCLPGWMGPACQYRNLAAAAVSSLQNPPQENVTYNSVNAVDLDETTCSKTGTGQGHRWLTITLESRFYLLGFVIKFPDTQSAEMFRGLSIDISNTTDTWSSCYKHEKHATTTEMLCDKPVVGQHVRLYLAEEDTTDLTICEIEIYGGRLVSFNRHTSIKSTYKDWNAFYGVDGEVSKVGVPQDTVTTRSCASTYPTYGTVQNHWWQLNLTTLFSIQAASFFGRQDQDISANQYRGFVVQYMREDGGFSQIFKDTPSRDPPSAYQPKSYNLTWPVDSQVIQILRQWTDILLVCELEAFAECPLGKCGWDCEKTCMCSSQTTGSYKILGTCPHGCAARWIGENRMCSTQCNDTHWGINCNLKCGNCQNPCDVVTGDCPTLCKPGWLPPECKNECSRNNFGQNCSKTCGMCKGDSACDPSTGMCPADCETGWETAFCNKTCDRGKYGNKCLNECGFCWNNTSCDHENGTCEDGCTAGFLDPLCKTHCPDGKYGRNCLEDCGQCASDTTCNRATGECSSGCLPGWKGTLCKEACQHGYYGTECNNSCGHCKNNKTCNNENGKCQACQPGYQLDLCVEVCEDGRYGVNCEGECGKCADGDICNKTTGDCPGGCQVGFVSSKCISATQHGLNIPSGTTGGIVGGIVGAFTIALAVVAVIILRRRLFRNLSKSKAKEELLTSPFQPDKEPSGMEMPEEQEQAETDCYCNADVFVTIPEYIEVKKLRSDCREAKRDPKALADEFERIPSGLLKDASEALDSKYLQMNRYKKICPYNENRVHLPETAGVPTSTYINASYITGYHRPKRYIAAQGPLKTRVDDFWRMIWSENVVVVVMLTNCVEAGKQKCSQYWPDEGCSVYGDVKTEQTSTESYTNFKIRTFQISQGTSKTKREVVQFHFTAWPDKDVPDTSLSIVQFWRTVREYVPVNKEYTESPWLVHCSAGVGRTGTFIALDYLYDQGQEEDKVDIKGCVLSLRNQRVKMVQTKEQYHLLHEIVAEILDPIGTVCSNEEFLRIYPALVSDPVLDKQKLFVEYKKICKASEEILEAQEEGGIYFNVLGTHTRGGGKPENIPKSRNSNICPEDKDRPYLQPYVDGCNDFINAVYIPTYRYNDRMIMTQFPLKNTVVDFLTMVWQYNINQVVLLENPSPEEGKYWPQHNKPLKVGPFTVKVIQEQSIETYVLKTLRLKMDGGKAHKDVRQYHFQKWNQEQNVPHDTASILHLITDLEKGRNSDESTPIVIQCLDGAKKSGVFCVIYSVLERLKLDRQVAVAQTLRLARVKRAQIIKNFDQYKYCHDVVHEYLHSFDVYANVT